MDSACMSMRVVQTIRFLISSHKIITFRLHKEKDDIRSAYVCFNFFHETINSYHLETANHIAPFIFVLHSAVKTHL